MKLARKLALAFLAVIVVVLAINAYVRTRDDVHVFESDMRRDHRIAGRALLPAIRNVWRDHGEPRASALVEEANAGVTHISVRWVWLEEDAAEAHRPLVDLQRVRAALEGGEAVIVDRDRANMLFTYLVAEGLPTPRQGALELAESLAEERAYVVSTIVRATVTTVAIITVCGALAWFLGIGLIGRPVDRMIDKLRRVGSGDFGHPLEIRGRDELTELASALNSMCVQLATESAERLRAQEALRHAERLTTVGKLASGIAHELGTPLHVISARAKMIASGRTTSVEECARVIREQCERMTVIIRQLLDFARKRGSVRWSSVELSSIVRETCELLEPLAKKRDIELVAPPPAAPASVCGDRGALQQVLSNLIVNAVQAMERPGRVVVEVGPTVERATTDGRRTEHACILVRDEGVGIPEDVLPHVFEPFFTTKGVGDGTGLGLSVAHGIVEEHGGKIEIESTVGAGTSVSVYLPIEVGS